MTTQKTVPSKTRFNELREAIATIDSALKAARASDDKDERERISGDAFSELQKKFVLDAHGQNQLRDLLDGAFLEAGGGRWGKRSAFETNKRLKISLLEVVDNWTDRVLDALEEQSRSTEPPKM